MGRLHKTYHVTGTLLAQRLSWERCDRDSRTWITDEILIDATICGATQETSALWAARSMALYEANYSFASWGTDLQIEEVTN